MEKTINQGEKILLVMFPYWEILIPPMGLSCLKSFLQKHGYPVKAVDVNIENQFKGVYDRYFKRFAGFVPEEKRGNFYNLGKDVLRQHLMAYINRIDNASYIDLVKAIIYSIFFCHVTPGQVQELDTDIKEFFDLLKSYFLDLLEREKPGILGISLFRGTIPASIFAARLAKERYPNMLTVVGGGSFADELCYGSSNLDFFIEKTKYDIDKIIIGEGELLFLKLLQGKLPIDKNVYTIADIGKETLDLATAAIPDFSDFELKDYPSLGTYTSRSCPFECSFCSETLQWGKFRKKKMEQAVDEMLEISRKYNRQLFLMSDSLLNPVVNDLSDELLKRDASVYWDGYFRVDQASGNMEKTFLWRRAGFYRARLGVESGSQKILDLMDKRITVEQIKSAISSLAHAGIKTTTYWLIGHPGETEADFQLTLDIIEELKDDIYEAWANIFWYYPYGQVKSGELRQKSKLLFPANSRDMLLLETRIIDGEPTREEMYSRMFRFLEHCKKIGVPNLYSLHDFHEADERWKRLHKNAAPSLVSLMDRNSFIDENKKLKQVSFAKNTLHENMDFSF